MSPHPSATIFESGSTIALAVLLVAVAGCKPEGPSCNPSEVQWRLQLAIQAAEVINPTEAGESLPTVVRVFQLRGDLALDGLDFEGLWEATEARELGESFLAMEELTLFAARDVLRELPVESEATHVLAAGLLRKPAGGTWFTSYELPTRHAETVCAKEPETKRYPNPCFYLRLDRNALDGGATPPAGYQVPSALQCAPLDAAPPPSAADAKKSSKKQRRKARRERAKGAASDELQDRLDGKSGTPEAPRAPQTPSPDVPRVPESPSVPAAPAVPGR